MIVTKELLVALGACPTGYKHVLKEEIIGKDHLEGVELMKLAGYVDDAAWFADAIRSPTILGFIGNYNIMQTKYYVFNPLTGNNEEFINRADAILRNRALREEYIRQHVDNLFVTINKEVTVASESSEILTVIEKELVVNTK